MFIEQGYPLKNSFDFGSFKFFFFLMSRVRIKVIKVGENQRRSS